MTRTAETRLAIVEDNDDLREELLYFLRHRGFSVWGAHSAEAFWKQLHRSPVDIVLIDLGLPGENGFGIVEYLYELGGYGLIVVTAHGAERDRLRALNLGADFFLVKPVNFAQLSTRIDELAKRLTLYTTEQETPGSPPAQQAGWTLAGVESQLFSPSGRSLDLSPKEFDLLRILTGGPQQVVTKQALHDLLFAHAPDEDVHRIDVILSRLRQKAREQGMQLPIRSIFGQGLVFAASATFYERRE